MIGSMSIIFSFIAAVLDALKSLAAKRSTKQEMGEWTTAFVWVATAAIVLFPLLFIKPFPSSIPLSFWIIVIIRVAIEIVGIRLFLRALKGADVSHILPLTGLLPLFVLLVSWGVNHEFPKLWSLSGIVLIILATYLLQNKKAQGSGSNRLNSWAMIGAVFIWALATSLHKIAIEETNIYFYTSVVTLVFAFSLFWFAWFLNRADFKRKNISRLWQPAHVGVLDGMTFGATMIAQSGTLNVIAISLRQTSLAVASLVAWIFLKESPRGRVVPVVLMLVGAVIILIAQKD